MKRFSNFLLLSSLKNVAMDYARVAKDTELKNASASDDGSSIDSRRKRSSDYQMFEPFHSRVVRFLCLL